MRSQRKPIYLLSGGRSSRHGAQKMLLQTVFRESGTATPAIGYVGVANDDDVLFFERTANIFQEAGALHVKHAVIATTKYNPQKLRDILIASDIIFIAGGDVEKGMQLLREREIIAYLNELYKGGKLFFGSSAGSIMLAKEWVRWTDPDNDSAVELFPCLGFASVICDTHDELEGWQELQTALMLEPDDTRGYGIVSGAGLKVYPDGKVHAVGSAVHQFIRRDKKVQRLNDLIP